MADLPNLVGQQPFEPTGQTSIMAVTNTADSLQMRANTGSDRSIRMYNAGPNIVRIRFAAADATDAGVPSPGSPQWGMGLPSGQGETFSMPTSALWVSLVTEGVGLTASVEMTMGRGL